MTDNTDEIMHQGKTISQWEKDFKGEFTYNQLAAMIKGGADLQKILMLGLDEEEEITPDEGLPGEKKIIFEEERSIKDYTMPNCQVRIFDETGNEIFWQWIDPGYLKSIIPYIGVGICGDNSLETNAVQAGAFFPENSWRKYDGQKLTTMIYVDGEPLSIDHQTLASQIRDVEARVKRVEQNAIIPSKIRAYNKAHALNEISHEDELAAFNESIMDRYDTIGNFKKALARNLAKDTDKLMFRVKKQAYEVFQMDPSNGTFVVDLVPEIKGSQMTESIIPRFTVKAKVKGTAMNFTSTASTEDEAKAEILDQLKKILDDKNPKVEIEEVTPLKKASLNERDAPNFSVTVKIGNIERGWTVNAEDEEDAEQKVLDKLMKKFKNLKNVTVTEVRPMKSKVDEGRNWKNGGYGGYGRSFKSYGEVGAPRGKSISWFNVSDLDPKASGKMQDWRVGPSNFPFEDLLYPNRKYKTGTTVMRNTHVQAGSESGTKYIAVPSYLDAIKNNDTEAIALLNAFGIPLDLTFGYEPGEDFSSTYSVKDVHNNNITTKKDED